ncbi:hypothetical protein ANN_11110 [Periplaneta americana]|uniref:Uncharacterized protein n=1 Tax=Periplaneta americana TaxID=6978 RepID=A0ABQ8T5I4_PERAM|nr:hypothetical protein ANN_11110 [Periplaneta americana]
MIIDPTIRFETYKGQPEDVHEEKRAIYVPTIPYYKDKYQLHDISVTGWMFGARGTIPNFSSQFCKTLELYKSFLNELALLIIREIHSSHHRTRQNQVIPSQIPHNRQPNMHMWQRTANSADTTQQRTSLMRDIRMNGGDWPVTCQQLVNSYLKSSVLHTSQRMLSPSTLKYSLPNAVAIAFSLELLSDYLYYVYTTAHRVTITTTLPLSDNGTSSAVGTVETCTMAQPTGCFRTGLHSLHGTSPVRHSVDQAGLLAKRFCAADWYHGIESRSRFLSVTY